MSERRLGNQFAYRFRDLHIRFSCEHSRTTVFWLYVHVFFLRKNLSSDFYAVAEVMAARSESKS